MGTSGIKDRIYSSNRNPRLGAAYEQNIKEHRSRISADTNKTLNIERAPRNLIERIR